MGREVRRVPADWRHPQYAPWEDGEGLIPLLRGPYSKRCAEWDQESDAWSRGMSINYSTREERPKSESELAYDRFEDWDSPRPIPSDYMPEWPEGVATHLMMYEDTTEGTPISPAFPTPEALARWLADNGASSFGYSTASYEDWLPTCRSGWAPSMVLSAGELMSGVSYQARDSDEHRNGENAKRLSGEAMPARAAGIAQLPVEPTLEMGLAGATEVNRHMRGPGQPADYDAAMDAYRAMVAYALNYEGEKE